MEHDLKCWPVYFEPLSKGLKTHEYRRADDRHFSVGDTLLLREWNPTTCAYTGRQVTKLVTHIVEIDEQRLELGHTLPYVIMSLQQSDTVLVERVLGVVEDELIEHGIRRSMGYDDIHATMQAMRQRLTDSASGGQGK